MQRSIMGQEYQVIVLTILKKMRYSYLAATQAATTEEERLPTQCANSEPFGDKVKDYKGKVTLSRQWRALQK